MGLFVDADRNVIEEALKQVPLDVIQFHGKETAAFCTSFGRPYLKAIRVTEDTNLHDVTAEYSTAAGILLDSYQKGIPGGTGETFNWDLIPSDLSLPVILAGGLTPENVSHAIERVKPYAVDVSSGVERSPGIKDGLAIEAFAQAVSSANTSPAL